MSGALIQGRQALRQGRRLFILDSCSRPGLKWPEKLAAQGLVRVKEYGDIQGSLPRCATEVDELTRPAHFYLTEGDQRSFVGEYTARRGYQHSETNQLILNLMKGMKRRGRSNWRYKGLAIEQTGRTFEAVLSKRALSEHTVAGDRPRLAHPGGAESMVRLLVLPSPSPRVTGPSGHTTLAATYRGRSAGAGYQAAPPPRVAGLR